MSREWKPGDVVLVEFDNATGDERSRGTSRIETRVALVSEYDGHASPSLEPVGMWLNFGPRTRIGSEWECVRSIRSLVVIDPEDREQVGRLADAFCLQRWSHQPHSEECDPLTFSSMQAALREFADRKPPKPDEPRGIGAVAEDSDGTQWVRTHTELDAHWREAAFQGCYKAWRHIDVVRVLSEGVTEDGVS